MLLLNSSWALTCLISPLGADASGAGYFAQAGTAFGGAGSFYAQTFNAAVADDKHTWPGSTLPPNAYCPPAKPGGLLLKQCLVDIAATSSMSATATMVDSAVQCAVAVTGTGTVVATATAIARIVSDIPGAPVLGAVTDLMESVLGGSVRCPLTPPTDAFYHHSQVYYHVDGAVAWTAGPTYTGTPGELGYLDITGLVRDAVYDFVAIGLTSDSVPGLPSVVRTCTPTNGATATAAELGRRAYIAPETRQLVVRETWPMLLWPSKDPDETVSYSLDWANRLGTDTVTISTWTLITGSGLTLSTDSFTGAGVTTLWLASGVDGTTYTLRNEVTTAAGCIYQQTVQIKVESR
jgi:hypothetical protein